MPDHLLPLPSGFDPATQAVVGTLAAGLDDQRRRLNESLAGLPVAALEWQSAPGMNAIGMLVAHLALVEVWWIHLAPRGEGVYAAMDPHFRHIVGIGAGDDGMDVKGATAFPAALRGKSAADYVSLLERARACVHADLLRWSDADLAKTVTGKRGSVSYRWILYHVLEHFAGHFGQIQLVKHQLRDAGILPRS